MTKFGEKIDELELWLKDHYNITRSKNGDLLFDGDEVIGHLAINSLIITARACIDGLTTKDIRMYLHSEEIPLNDRYK